MDDVWSTEEASESAAISSRMLPSSQSPQAPPSSLQSALQMDPAQHLQLQQQQQQQQLQSPQQPQPPPQSSNKRRKKTEQGTDEVQSPSEPRRLRRSHEACARCRSKKIKASPDGRHRRQFPSCHTRLTTFLAFSVIRNIHDVQPVRLQVSLVTRRTVIDRL